MRRGPGKLEINRLRKRLIPRAKPRPRALAVKEKSQPSGRRRILKS